MMNTAIRNVKSRICAGFVALTLAGAVPVLAQEEVKYDEKDAALIEHAEKLHQMILNPKIYKYVSEDGKEEKWICSLEEELDGLHRTEEYKEYIYPYDRYLYDDKVFEDYECPVEEPHYHPVGFTIEFDDYQNKLIYYITSDEEKEQRYLDWFGKAEDPENNSDITMPLAIKCTKEEYEMLQKTELVPRVLYVLTSRFKEQLEQTNDKLLMLNVKETDDAYIVEEKAVEPKDYKKYVYEYPYYSFHGVCVDDDFTPSFQTVSK